MKQRLMSELSGRTQSPNDATKGVNNKKFPVLALRSKPTAALTAAFFIFVVFVVLLRLTTPVVVSPSRVTNMQRPAARKSAVRDMNLDLNKDVFADVEFDELESVGEDATSSEDPADRLIRQKDLDVERSALEKQSGMSESSSSNDLEHDQLVRALSDEEEAALSAAADGNEHMKTDDAAKGQILPPPIGPGADCDINACRLCDQLQVTNRGVTARLPEHVIAYLDAHVVLSIITGSFDDFFRADLALCTWAGHMPRSRLHVFTDKAAIGQHPATGTRIGVWHEAQLPRSLRFSKRQLHAKGYTIDWIRAQYRFVQAFQVAANQSLLAARRDNSSDRAAKDAVPFSPDVHWAMVADDDTFVNLEALVLLLTAYDIRELVRLRLLPDGTRFNASSALLVSSLVTKHRHLFRPMYLNERGWGGAGHILNYASFPVFVNRSETVCVDHYMVRKGFASDVTLKKCLPVIGVSSVHERALSHCQANYLRRRLTSRTHVTAHIKRDVVKPAALAMWRTRLYYQVAYHRNVTIAYQLLMRVGACAYGASCKLKHCDEQHDAAAVAFFLRHSDNGTKVPPL